MRSLVHEEIRDGVIGIQLHDLVHYFGVNYADQEGCSGVWRRRLIDCYSADFSPAYTANTRADVTTSTCPPWWSST
jgi:hypothetical protein